MAWGKTPTTTTEGPLTTNQVFISSVAVPNHANGDLTALEGGPASTDGNGNETAPASMWIKDGGDVTQGSSTDANTVNSVMGRLTKIRDLLSATLTVAGNVTEANSASIKADLDAILAALDDGQETMANSLSVAIASDQSAVPVSGTITANAGTNLNTSLLALESGGNLAAAKADLDTIVTNTNKIPASPAQEGGNLATLAGAISAGKMQTTVTNANANGQSTMVNSAPVVIASDQSVIKVKQDFLEVAGQAAGSVTSTSTPIILSTDVSAYKSWSFQMTGTWSMTLQVQFSDDNVNFLPYFLVSSSSGSISSTIAANGIYGGPTFGRYMRIIPSAWTSNASGVGTLELYSHPYTTYEVFAVQQGIWTVQQGSTPSTTPWLMTQANNNASVPTGAANTVIKASAGQLATIVVTTAGTGAGNVQIFDNASTNSGTVLFAFPATVSVAQAYQIYGWAKNGMTAQNVANGPVFTVFYA